MWTLWLCLKLKENTPVWHSAHCQSLSVTLHIIVMNVCLLRSCRVDTSAKRRESKKKGEQVREMVGNCAEANEASLVAANWCFNLWLWLSWCFSLPARRLGGISAEQTFCLQTSILTFTSFSERHKKCSSFIRLTGTSQTDLTSLRQSQKGGQRWAGEVRAAQRGRKWVKEVGQMMGWKWQEFVRRWRVRSGFAS